MNIKVTGKRVSTHHESVESIYLKKALALIEKEYNLPTDLHPEDNFVEGANVYSDSEDFKSEKSADEYAALPSPTFKMKPSDATKQIF
jgi:hypothetical protein